MHATVFRVVTISDLWEENWILAESSWVPEVVSVVGAEFLRKDKCVQKRKRPECVRSLPRTSYLLTGAMLRRDGLDGVLRAACVLLSLLVKCSALSTASIACGACTLVVTELEAGIAGVDRRKRTKVGGYHLDAAGNQADAVEVSYSRSEMHITDILENVCDKSAEWTAVVHPTTGKGIYARRASLKLKQVSDRPSIYRLTEACSDFLDSFEDQLVTFAQKEHKEPVRQFCHDTARVCTAVDVTPLPEKLEKAERDSLVKVERMNDEEGFKAVEETFDDRKKQADEL